MCVHLNGEALGYPMCEREVSHVRSTPGAIHREEAKAGDLSRLFKPYDQTRFSCQSVPDSLRCEAESVK